MDLSLARDFSTQKLKRSAQISMADNFALTMKSKDTDNGKNIHAHLLIPTIGQLSNDMNLTNDYHNVDAIIEGETFGPKASDFNCVIYQNFMNGQLFQTKDTTINIPMGGGMLKIEQQDDTTVDLDDRSFNATYVHKFI